jgi:hypothetical protein
MALAPLESLPRPDKAFTKGADWSFEGDLVTKAMRSVEPCEVQSGHFHFTGRPVDLGIVLLQPGET